MQKTNNANNLEDFRIEESDSKFDKKIVFILILLLIAVASVFFSMVLLQKKSLTPQFNKEKLDLIKNQTNLISQSSVLDFPVATKSAPVSDLQAPDFIKVFVLDGAQNVTYNELENNQKFSYFQTSYNLNFADIKKAKTDIKNKMEVLGWKYEQEAGGSAVVMQEYSKPNISAKVSFLQAESGIRVIIQAFKK